MDFRDTQEASVTMATDTIDAATSTAPAAAETSTAMAAAKRKLATRGDLEGSEAAALSGRGRSFA